MKESFLKVSSIKFLFRKLKWIMLLYGELRWAESDIESGLYCRVKACIDNIYIPYLPYLS